MHDYPGLMVQDVTLGAVAVIPIIVAIIQALKMTGWFPNKFAPLLSIAIGILITFVMNHANPDWSATLLNGVVYGLSASGLYAGVKETAHVVKREEKNGHTTKKK